jgi:hypothetical protein
MSYRKLLSSPSPAGLSDTTAEAQRVRHEILRRLSFADRMRMVDELTVTVQELAREGLRARHPSASEEELSFRFSEMVLGPELATRVLAYRRALSGRGES